MRHKLASVAALVVLLVLFFAINLLAGEAMRSARLDLTQGKVYTLTEGTGRVCRGLEEPIKLAFFFSEKLAAGEPALQAHGRRVRELLEEYARLSRRDGRAMIELEVVDPQPASEEEDRAQQAGLIGLPSRRGAGEGVYMGLLGTNSIDGREVIPFFDPQRERFLEYDLSRLVYALANPKRAVVGLMSTLPIDGGFTIDPATRQPRQSRPWAIAGEIRGLFDVRQIDPGVLDIARDVDVLLVVHPRGLSDATLYAIDQHVMRGGRLIALVDPLCEEEGGDPSAGADRSSSLEKLLGAWGVEIVPGMVAADDRLAIPVNVGQRGRGEQISYVPWLSVGRDGLERQDPVTAQLSQLILLSAGVVRATEAPPEGEQAPRATITPLVTTTESSMLVDVSRLAFMPDPKGLLGTFASGGEKLTLAARLSGKVRSAFPQGRPAPADAEAAPADPSPALAESAGSIQVLVVGDCDMLSDRTWVQQTPLGNLKQSDNADFLVNAIDDMTGSADLVQVRARGAFSRPFTVVDEMERQAEQKYRAEQSLLETKLREAEAKLAELERQKDPSQPGDLRLTKEQVAELEKFREERAQTRQQLRGVRFDLRQDVERLGTRVKLINIALVPAAVALAAVGLGLYRVSRRGSAKRTMSRAE